MTFFENINGFLKLRKNEKWLILVSITFLYYYLLKVTYFPKTVKLKADYPIYYNYSQKELIFYKASQKRVNKLSNILPHYFSCLVKSLTIKLILEYYKIPSRIILTFEKSEKYNIHAYVDLYKLEILNNCNIASFAVK